jgi:transcription antitermination factor NusG
MNLLSVTADSEIQSERKWYAVFTKALWEKKVARLLDKKKVHNYCPLTKVHRQWSDRKKVIEVPLFTSYVFVYITEKEKLAIRQTEGVINFVYWLSKPAVIQNEEINLIKRFLSEHSHVTLEKTTVQVNDRIRILSGPLMEREGNILEVRHKSIKVQLPSLGYALVVEVEKSNIENLSIFSREQMAIAQ